MFDKEYVFYGKHAFMVDELKGSFSDKVGKGFFSTVYDVYRVAPIIGFIYKRKAERDRSSDKTTKIFYEKLNNEKDDLIFNYRTLMMLLNKDKTDDEKMEIAFKLDNKNDERKEYDELYDSYVLGGVEELHERLIVPGDKSEDTFIMNLFDFINDLNVRLYGADIGE